MDAVQMDAAQADVVPRALAIQEALRLLPKRSSCSAVLSCSPPSRTCWKLPRPATGVATTDVVPTGEEPKGEEPTDAAPMDAVQMDAAQADVVPRALAIQEALHLQQTCSSCSTMLSCSPPSRTCWKL